MKSLKIKPQVFKHLDSNTELTINLISGIKEVQLNPEHSYKLKIKNNTGYLTEYDLEIKDDQLVLTTDKLKDFTPDDYEVEVWDSYEDKDSIYPDEDYGTFKIDKNVAEVKGKTIPVITIEEFNKRIDEALKKVESIEQIKGEKGDKGDKGDTGERGADGKDGKDGVNGKDGKDGTNGVDGKNGQDGKSAYQIWLDLGNSGSEQDFINSLKAQSERHAPTGYMLDTSTKPWTLVFDNGCILDDVWHWNNNLIFRPENNGNLNIRSIPMYSIPDLIMKVIRGVLIPSDFQNYDGGWFDQKTRIINPVNDAEEYDWNSITPEKKRRFIRCMYELGIWGGAIVEELGAVRKAGN